LSQLFPLDQLPAGFISKFNNSREMPHRSNPNFSRSRMLALFTSSSIVVAPVPAPSSLPAKFFRMPGCHATSDGLAINIYQRLKIVPDRPANFKFRLFCQLDQSSMA
jgi:hypothetical protein